MLNLLQSHNKKAPLIILILFLSLTTVSSLQLGISPPSLELKGDIKTILCKDITITSDSKLNLTGEIKWSKQNIRLINEYNIHSQDLNITSQIENSLYLKNYKTTEKVCLSADKPGSYNGLLIYKTTERGIGVGTWVNLRINGKIQQETEEQISPKNEYIPKLLITGNTIANTPENKPSLVLPGMIILQVFLLIIFFYTLVIIKKR
ncbi:MAG: hypothetical protein Q7S74_02230 [Nanoarchaeota archaeon]|nr:hypothetical protein [Nanoarchaeota archaeon]